MRRVKAVLDPAGILNPGKRLPEAGADSRQGDVRRCRLSCAPATPACAPAATRRWRRCSAAAAAAGQFLPVDADAATDRARAAAAPRRRAARGALRTPARPRARGRDRRAVAGVGGRQGRRRLRPAPHAARQRVRSDWAVFRLARLPERRERLLARGGDAFALAEALRADPAEPAALVVLEPGPPRHRRGLRRRRAVAAPRAHIERCARAAGAELEELDEAAWLALCAGLPTSAVRMAGRDARVALPAHDGAVGLRRGAAPRARHARGSRGARARASCAARQRRARRGRRRSGARHDGDRSQRTRGASASTRSPASASRAGSACRHCPTFDLLAAEIGRPARPDPHHAAPGGRRSTRRGGARARSIAASAAAPARRPARRTCSTASCSRSPATAARRRPPCRCARCSRSCDGRALLALALRAGRPLARFLPGRRGSQRQRRSTRTRR